MLAPNPHRYVGNPLAWIDPLGLAAYKVVAENDAGRFGDLNPGVPGDDLEAHHMPQDGLGHLSRNDGGAIVMKAEDHALTRTYKSLGRATKGDRQLVLSVGGGWWVGSPSGSGCGLPG